MSSQKKYIYSSRPVDETPLAPWNSAAVDELIAVTAAGEDGSRHDHGGGEAVATRVGEALDISSVDSSDEEDDEK